jgi:hypothetical protein
MMLQGQMYRGKKGTPQQQEAPRRGIMGAEGFLNSLKD